MVAIMLFRLRSAVLVALLLIGRGARALRRSRRPRLQTAEQTQAPAPVRHGGGEANLVLPDLGS